MTSLARGLAVIRAFSDDAESSHTMVSISTQTGLSRAVVRRCLYTLEQMGYVRSTTSGYQLEPQVLALAQPYFSSSSLPVLAQEFLDRVKQETNESCSLAVLDGDDVVYVARSAAGRIMTVSIAIGSRLPAYCTSLGRVLLSALSHEELADYLRRVERRRNTKHTLTTVRDLNQAIACVRDQGYALVNEELEIGLRSIAVPVRDRNQSVVAAINVGAQATRMNQQAMLRKILPVLRAAGDDLGDRLVG